MAVAWSGTLLKKVDNDKLDKRRNMRQPSENFSP